MDIKEKEKVLKELRGVKARTWLAVFYPESLPADWEDRLKEFADKVFIGPLHDKDISEDGSGTPKKAHYHIIMDFCNDKRGDTIADFCFSLNQPMPQKCNSIASAVRYLVHKDHPDKYQYSKSDIKEYGKARGSKCADDYLTSNADETSDLNEILDFCEENNIYSLSILRKYSRKEKPDWNDLIMRKHAYVIKNMLKSAEYDLFMELKNEFYRKINNSGLPNDSFLSSRDYAEYMICKLQAEAKEKFL